MHSMHENTEIQDCWCQPPPSLQRWHELLHEMKAWSDTLPEDWPFHKGEQFDKITRTFDAWWDRLDNAWLSAPRRDCVRMRCILARRGWEDFKKAMREARAS